MNHKSYRTFREVEADYFHHHPDEIDAYILEVFDDYGNDGNLSALIASLRNIMTVKGIHYPIEDNQNFDQVNAMIHALGYRLKPELIKR